MKQLQFSVQIQAPRAVVWGTLWQDESFRDWAGLIDPGTYMVGELKEGNQIQFISAENGYGVTSLVDKVIENEQLVLLHQADTQDSGQNLRAPEWTGGAEMYELREENGATILTATFDTPDELIELFNTLYPKALDRVRALAEQTALSK